MQDSSFNMDEKKEAFTRPGHVLLEWIRIVFCTALRHLFRTTFLIINMYRAYMCLLLISLFSIGVLSCVGARVLLDGRGEGGLSLPVCLCSCNACNTYGVASYLLGSKAYIRFLGLNMASCWSCIVSSSNLSLIHI